MISGEPAAPESDSATSPSQKNAKNLLFFVIFWGYSKTALESAFVTEQLRHHDVETAAC